MARRAQALEAQGRPDRAVIEYQKAVRLDPNTESHYTDLAHLLLRTQNFHEAIVVLEAARPRFPKSAQIPLSLGVAYYGQRRFGEAVGAFLGASKLDPDAEQPVAFLGRILEHAADRLDEVTACFAAFSERHPDHWLGHFLSGKAAGDEKSLRRSIALQPGYWESHFELGSVLEQRNRDLPAALVEYQEAARLAPKTPAPHYRLFRLYTRLGQAEKAASERALHEKLAAEEKAELERRQASTRHMELKVQ